MNIHKVRFLREILVADGKGNWNAVMEFSYDDRYVNRQRFFGVPDNQQESARELYREWGGNRLEGYRRGPTVERP